MYDKNKVFKKFWRNLGYEKNFRLSSHTPSLQLMSSPVYKNKKFRVKNIEFNFVLVRKLKVLKLKKNFIYITHLSSAKYYYLVLNNVRIV